MIKIYGKKLSRAARCMWVLEELGLPYDQVPLNTQNGETRTPEFLALNPSGKVPVLDDDGFILRESVAICLYLTSKAPTPLWPDDIRAQAYIHQWTNWAVTEVEAPLSVLFLERRRAPETGLDSAFATERLKGARDALTLLEGHLSARPYVAGDDFTLGDILACATVMLVPMFIELAPYPAIRDWFARCTARPAWKRVEARD